MDKINFSSPRVQLALRFFTYGVMAISTIVLTLVAIFYAMGYRFNQDLAIEQGGLVQVRSTPEGAAVYVDGKRTTDDTPGRAYMDAGQHTVEMQLTNYHSWKRTFDIAPGQLLWLDYTRFIPTNLQTTPLREFPTLTSLTASPDKRWLLLQEASNSPTFALVDIADEKSPVFTALTIPDAQITKKNGTHGTFSVVEWDLGSRYVLIRHEHDGLQEFLRVDRTKPAETVNISTLFRLNVSQAHFAGGNPNVLYAQTDSVLRRLDIPAANASAALISDMVQFDIYGGDRIAFVADRETTSGTRERVVGVYGDGKETIVRTYPLGTRLQIDLTEYFRHAYLAINSGNNQIDIVRDPADQSTDSAPLVTFTLDTPPTWLSFSSSGRMVAAGSGNSWTTYDLEVGKAYSAKVDGTVHHPLKWLDNFYLAGTVNGQAHIVEFDGLNGHSLATAADGFAVTLSQNGKSFISIQAAQSGHVVQSTRLVVE